jgi:hypothetical protein
MVTITKHRHTDGCIVATTQQRHTECEYADHYTTYTHLRRAWWPLHYKYTLDASMATITPETHWSQVWQPLYILEVSMVVITPQLHFGCKHGDHYTRDALEPSMTTITYTGGEHGSHYTTYKHWRRAWWPFHHRYALEASIAIITQQIPTGGEHGDHCTKETLYLYWNSGIQ